MTSAVLVSRPRQLARGGRYADYRHPPAARHRSPAAVAGVELSRRGRRMAAACQ
ncbi:hypothetical protein IE991_26630 [Klebsiella pneumoniae]|nr:hypothetical protein [Klebsiella pneumoniae]